METTTEKNNRVGFIRIPYAIIASIVAVILFIFGQAIIGSAHSSADHTQIQVNTKVINEEIKPDLKRLQETKADKADFDKIWQMLLTIDGKLDSHIGKEINKNK